MVSTFYRAIEGEHPSWRITILRLIRPKQKLRSRNTSLVLTVILLSSTTIFTVVFVPRFILVGENLLAGLMHEAKTTRAVLGGWGSGSANVISLPPSKELELFKATRLVPVDRKYQHLLASASMRFGQIGCEREPWHKGLLLISFLAEDGKVLTTIKALGVSESLGSLGRTSNRFLAQSRILIPPEATHLRVLAVVFQANGNPWVEDLSLRYLSDNRAYAWILNSLFCFWGIALLYVGFAWSGASHRRAVLTVSLVLLVLLGVLAPQHSLFELVEHIKDIGIPLDLSWKGWGHVILFSLLTALILPCNGRGWRSLYMVGILLLAALTESVQHLVPGRKPSLEDFLLDALGVVLGCPVSLWLQARWSNMRAKEI